MGGGFEREFGRNEMGMSRSFGETLERGIGKYAELSTFTKIICFVIKKTCTIFYIYLL